MGQNLPIGIVTCMGVSKKDLEKGKITQTELIEKIKKALSFPMEIFDKTETEDCLDFNLKNDVFTTQLVPLLQRFYPLVYQDPDEIADFIGVLDELKSRPSTEWMNIAEDQSFYSFQKDEYAQDDILRFDKGFRPSVHVCYEGIRLSSEGKIMMEVYGRQFRFWKFCMSETFKEIPLAGALRIYFTG